MAAIGALFLHATERVRRVDAPELPSDTVCLCRPPADSAYFSPPQLNHAWQLRRYGESRFHDGWGTVPACHRTCPTGGCP
jgi:hypothetical protein